MAKKFELVETDKPDTFNAYVKGKFRGLIVKSGRSDYMLTMGKRDVVNFTNKKDLEKYLVEKFS